ncbi:hypothetical protein D1872_36760 [compost metagenome]
MKVWIIMKSAQDRVMAITEDESLGQKYMKIKGFDNDYSFFFVKDRIANNMLIDYDDLYLEDDMLSKTVVTRAERKIIEEIILTEQDKIENASRLLASFVAKYNISKKEAKKILECQNILIQHSQGKLLRKWLKLNKFIRNLGKGNTDADQYQQRVEQSITNRIRVWLGYTNE